jgi:hypothetical protein
MAWMVALFTPAQLVKAILNNFFTILADQVGLKHVAKRQNANGSPAGILNFRVTGSASIVEVKVA